MKQSKNHQTQEFVAVETYWSAGVVLLCGECAIFVEQCDYKNLWLLRNYTAVEKLCHFVVRACFLLSCVAAGCYCSCDVCWWTAAMVATNWQNTKLLMCWRRHHIYNIPCWLNVSWIAVGSNLNWNVWLDYFKWKRKSKRFGMVLCNAMLQSEQVFGILSYAISWRWFCRNLRMEVMKKKRLLFVYVKTSGGLSWLDWEAVFRCHDTHVVVRWLVYPPHSNNGGTQVIKTFDCTW